jgi:hypothetical protein
MDRDLSVAVVCVKNYHPDILMNKAIKYCHMSSTKVDTKFRRQVAVARYSSLAD